MRLIITVLFFLFGILQYQLWFGAGGVLNAVGLSHAVAANESTSQVLAKRNAILRADIENLKHGTEAVEAHARYDLGMVKKGEVFYQITTSS